MVAALAAVLALPFLVRRSEEPTGSAAADRAEAPARRLVIISPHWTGIREEFGRAFSAYTLTRFGYRTEIDWRDHGGTSDCIRYVQSEFSRTPEGIGYDIFFGGGVDPYIQLTKADLLSPVNVPGEVLDAIPRTYSGIELYDGRGRWFGACLSGFGILYNCEVMRIMGLRRPQTWEDLARSENLGWVGSGDPRFSGSVHMVYEIIAQAYGWERGWSNIIRMGANVRSFSRAASQVPKDTALGEVAFGMAIDTYGWKEVERVGRDRMGFLMPQGLTVINPDGIAVLKGAPNRDVAEQFITFVLSEAGQKLWALKVGAPGGPRRYELYRMPVIPGLVERLGDEAVISFDPFRWKAGFDYDADKGALRWGVLNDLIGAMVIDTHQELVEAWRAVRDLPDGDPRVAELVKPPMTEEQMLALARGKYSDPEVRARMKTEWATEAKRRYGRIARGE
jgi:ABC-type Fe3+ transport system substrate-binding protein